jgi:hypothetical protein
MTLLELLIEISFKDVKVMKSVKKKIADMFEKQFGGKVIPQKGTDSTLYINKNGFLSLNFKPEGEEVVNVSISLKKDFENSLDVASSLKIYHNYKPGSRTSTDYLGTGAKPGNQGVQQRYEDALEKIKRAVSQTERGSMTRRELKSFVNATLS